jgi:hypothetical protein
MDTQLYFISGLGADHRLFENQIASNIPITVIDWKRPLVNEQIEDYAKRMVAEIPNNNKSIIIGGVSFGGMMAIEMQKFLPDARVIIISSIKSYKELPPHIKIWRYIPIYKLLSGNFIKRAGITCKFIFGSMNKGDVELFSKMVSDADPVFIKWAIHQIVNWKNKKFPKNIIHLHGSRDLIFPILFLKKPFISFRGGDHLMIKTKSEEINYFLHNGIIKG